MTTGPSYAPCLAVGDCVAALVLTSPPAQAVHSIAVAGITTSGSPEEPVLPPTRSSLGAATWAAQEVLQQGYRLPIDLAGLNQLGPGLLGGGDGPRRHRRQPDVFHIPWVHVVHDRPERQRLDLHL